MTHKGLNRAQILFRDDKAGRDVLFAAPSSIIRADTPDTFEAAWKAMQRAHEAGKWLAGYLSYEAGYLLEPKLKELLPENRKAPFYALVSSTAHQMKPCTRAAMTTSRT